MNSLQTETYRKATIPATAPASKYWNLDSKQVEKDFESAVTFAEEDIENE